MIPTKCKNIVPKFLMNYILFFYTKTYFLYFQFSPLIQDTVLKGTFNATLNNPIAPRYDLNGASAANHPFLLGV